MQKLMKPKKGGVKQLLSQAATISQQSEKSFAGPTHQNISNVFESNLPDDQSKAKERDIK